MRCAAAVRLMDAASGAAPPEVSQAMSIGAATLLDPATTTRWVASVPRRQ